MDFTTKQLLALQAILIEMEKCNTTDNSGCKIENIKTYQSKGDDFNLYICYLNTFNGNYGVETDLVFLSIDVNGIKENLTLKYKKEELIHKFLKFIEVKI